MSLFNLYIFYLFWCYFSGRYDSVAGWQGEYLLTKTGEHVNTCSPRPVNRCIPAHRDRWAGEYLLTETSEQVNTCSLRLVSRWITAHQDRWAGEYLLTKTGEQVDELRVVGVLADSWVCADSIKRLWIGHLIQCDITTLAPLLHLEFKIQPPYNSPYQLFITIKQSYQY